MRLSYRTTLIIACTALFVTACGKRDPAETGDSAKDSTGVHPPPKRCTAGRGREAFGARCARDPAHLHCRAGPAWRRPMGARYHGNNRGSRDHSGRGDSERGSHRTAGRTGTRACRVRASSTWPACVTRPGISSASESGSRRRAGRRQESRRRADIMEGTGTIRRRGSSARGATSRSESDPATGLRAFDRR